MGRGGQTLANNDTSKLSETSYIEPFGARGGSWTGRRRLLLSGEVHPVGFDPGKKEANRRGEDAGLYLEEALGDVLGKLFGLMKLAWIVAEGLLNGECVVVGDDEREVGDLAVDVGVAGDA
jgi:hypothetical protein